MQARFDIDKYTMHPWLHVRGRWKGQKQKPKPRQRQRRAMGLVQWRRGCDELLDIGWHVANQLIHGDSSPTGQPDQNHFIEDTLPQGWETQSDFFHCDGWRQPVCVFGNYFHTYPLELGGLPATDLSLCVFRAFWLSGHDLFLSNLITFCRDRASRDVIFLIKTTNLTTLWGDHVVSDPTCDPTCLPFFKIKFDNHLRGSCFPGYVLWSKFKVDDLVRWLCCF